MTSKVSSRTEPQQCFFVSAGMLWMFTLWDRNINHQGSTTKPASILADKIEDAVVRNSAFTLKA